jgi:hypothetical protein
MTRVLQADQFVPRLTPQWDSTLLEWHISSDGEIREQFEHHQDMLRYHRGDKVFWFDGGINGRVENRQFVGYGDGVSTDFFLPDRWIYSDSLVMSQNYAVVSTWVHTPSTGMLRWTTAPADGVMIHADKYLLRFKGYFVVDSDKLHTITDNFKSFATKDITIREFPY